MKKVFLLILFFFLLNSCSGIKIVVEKECDCKCDTKEKIQQTKAENKDVFLEQDENIEKPKLIKYLTGKFTINGDDNYTYVYYKNILVAKFENSIYNFSTDELEEKPIIKEEKNILKREIVKKIQIKKISKNFYIVFLKNTNKKYLFDILNKKSFNIDFVKSPFKKVIFGRSGKYFMYSGGKKCDGGLLYINNDSLKLKKVFENNCNYLGEYPETYKEITSFELGNGVINVYYINYLGDRDTEIIELDSIK